MLEIQHDLRDARALLEKSGTKDEKKKYRKAAEIILRKSLNADPANEEAKALLQHARAFLDSFDAPPPPLSTVIDLVMLGEPRA